MSDDTITVSAPWPAPGPHPLDELAGIHAGLQFREREQLYDALVRCRVPLDRERFRSAWALYRNRPTALGWWIRLVRGVP